MRHLKSEDLPNALPWIRALPPGPTRDEAWAGLAVTVGESADLSETFDLDGKSGKTMATQSDRDAFLASLILQPNLEIPQPGWTQPLDRLVDIQNPALRRQAFDDALALAAEANDEDRLAATRTWLEKSHVPEDWKKSALEVLRGAK